MITSQLQVAEDRIEAAQHALAALQSGLQHAETAAAVVEQAREQTARHGRTLLLLAIVAGLLGLGAWVVVRRRRTPPPEEA